VFVAVYANFPSVALLFAIGRHAGGSPTVFPVLYAVAALCSVIGAHALIRATPGHFRLGFAALAINAINQLALYIINERMMASGAVPENLLGYLYAATFTVAIASLGFLCKPESQRRAGFGPVDAMEE
jgi:hypothetical protein